MAEPAVDSRGRAFTLRGLSTVRGGSGDYGSVAPEDDGASSAVAAHDSPPAGDDDDAAEQGAAFRGNTCATRTLWWFWMAFVCLMRVVTGSKQSVGERFLEEERKHKENGCDESFGCLRCWYNEQRQQRQADQVILSADNTVDNYPAGIASSM